MVFQEPVITRLLRIDDQWRSVTAAWKAHGARPDSYQSAALPGLGANYVLRGQGRYTDWEGRTYPLGPGTLFQRLPGKVHSTWIDPRSDYAELFLVLDPRSSVALLQMGLISAVPVLDVGVHPAVVDEFRQLRACLDSSESERPTSVVLLQVLQFLQGLYERARQARRQGFWEETVGQACTLLERGADQRESLETLARQLGVSYSSLRKHFREITGTSPGDYRIRRRLERACGQLLDSPVTKVAADLGYCDPFTFSAQFKRFIGLSPRRFQEKMAGTRTTADAGIGHRSR